MTDTRRTARIGIVLLCCWEVLIAVGYTETVVNFSLLRLSADGIFGLQAEEALGLGVRGADPVVTMIIGAVVVGILGDLLGRRRLLLIGLAVLSLSQLAAAIAPNAELLIGARLVGGLAAGGLVPLALVLVTSHAEPGRRLRDAAWALTGLMVGMAGSTVIGYLLYVPGGWRWMLGFGAVPIVLVVVLMRTLPVEERPIARPAEFLEGLFAVPQRRVLLVAMLVALIAMLMAFYTGSSQASAFASYRLQLASGFSLGTDIVLRAIAAGVIVAFAFLAERRGLRQSLLLAMYAAAVLMLVLFLPDAWPLHYGAVVIAGMLAQAVVLFVAVGSSQAVAPRFGGATIGLVLAAASLGHLIGVVLADSTFALWRIPAAFAGINLLGFVLVAGALLLLPRTPNWSIPPQDRGIVGSSHR